MGNISLLAAGITPISCSNGWNGLPRSKLKDISPTPFKSRKALESLEIEGKSHSYLILEAHNDNCRTNSTKRRHCNSSASPIAIPPHNDKRVCPSHPGRHIEFPTCPKPEVRATSQPYEVQAHHIIRTLPVIHLLLHRLLVPVIEVFARMSQHLRIP